MNDSLELIKSEIYDAKSNLQKFNKLSQAEPEKYSFWVTYFTNRLNILEHIKSKLEAWEVVKEHCDYQDGDVYNCIPEGFYIIEPIRGKDFLIVKKALEVKDE